MSEAGHPAAHCFLRIHQTEYFEKHMPEVLHSLSGMPNVSEIASRLQNANFAIVSSHSSWQAPGRHGGRHRIRK